MTQKHKWYDVIVAWASGEEIQYFELGSEGWVNYTPFGKNSIPAFSSADLKWRIKPKTITKRYQTALVARETWIDVTDNSIDTPVEYDVPGFIRWVGDVVEVEVEV